MVIHQAMNLTSRYITHFTKSADSLKGILSIGFKIKYCRERIMFRSVEKKLRVPVVSFCDIPILQAEDNIIKYGNYAVGLREQWAIEQGLTPVIYLQQHSYLAESLLRTIDLVVSNEAKSEIAKIKKYTDKGLSVIDAIKEVLKLGDSGADEDDALMDALDVLRYTKNYVGELVRASGERVDEYYFADEREWRYAFRTAKFHQFLYIEGTVANEGFEKMMQELIEGERLMFSADDVSYLLIKEEDDRSEIERHIEGLESRFSQKDMEALKAKIYTLDQISNLK